MHRDAIIYISAYALPMFRQNRESSTKKQDEKARKDPVKSHRPDLPIYGPGKSVTLIIVSPVKAGT